MLSIRDLVIYNESFMVVIRDLYTFNWRVCFQPEI